jgi:hypothetical protein
MYELLMCVDELNVSIVYTNYEKALLEFKECVQELLQRSDSTDNVLVKIQERYAICVIHNVNIEYTLELKPMKGDE